jgi:hypothetical protein
MTIQFWPNDPSMLFNKDTIFDILPRGDMSYEEKLNAITRLIIVITILGYIFTFSTRILLVSFFTLTAIYIFTVQKRKITKEMINEGFKLKKKEDEMLGNSSQYIDPVTLESVLKTEFKEGTKKNPFSNILLTQIMDEPERKPAPPAFNVDVEEDITKNVKRAVQFMNPNIDNTNKQLFGDIWEKFNLDQSNRIFYSTPNTRVSNDQSAYAKFLYDDLKYSAKESTAEGNMTRVADAYRYTLY